MVAAAVLLLAWQVLVASGLKPSYALPSRRPMPGVAGRATPAGSAQRSIVGSLRRAAIGFAISVILGTLLEVMLSRVRLIRRGISLVTGMQSLPSVAWVPAAILWFGLTDAAVYAVILPRSGAPSPTVCSPASTTPPSCRRGRTVLGAEPSRNFAG